MKAPMPLQFFYNKLNPDFNSLLDEIHELHANACVFFGESADIVALLKEMNLRKMKMNMFGSWWVVGENNTLKDNLYYLNGLVMVSSGHWFTKKGELFRRDFQHLYGYQPGPVAAYAYDGMNLIIEAIRKSGTDREAIINTLNTIKFDGVTGNIQFDEQGNRREIPGLMEIKDGTPVNMIR